MAPETTPPTPGGMTVPPLFGWEGVLVVVAVVVVLAVVYLLVLAAGPAKDGRSEWQAFLDARSGRPGAADPPGEQAGPGDVHPPGPGDGTPS
jgi:hypothetical protein